ncbi:hypothetical protein BD311DRAFT_597375, partial [Dichomitus squalens]
EAQQPICIETMINGVPAYTLIDTGCTMVAMSPGQAFISKADRIDLQEQMSLQLGTKGSRTRINHGARAMIKVGSMSEPCYFDVVDIDRYDVVLGTPFLKKHNVVLDFKNRSVKI